MLFLLGLFEWLQQEAKTKPVAQATLVNYDARLLTGSEPKTALLEELHRQFIWYRHTSVWHTGTLVSHSADPTWAIAFRPLCRSHVYGSPVGFGTSHYRNRQLSLAVCDSHRLSFDPTEPEDHYCKRCCDRLLKKWNPVRKRVDAPIDELAWTDIWPDINVDPLP